MVLRRLGPVAFASLSVAAAALPACSTTANVSRVWMSIDDDGSRPRGTFFTDSAKVVCVAEIGIGRDDVTLEFVFRRIIGTTFAKRAFEPENTIVAVKDLRPGRTEGKPGRASMALVPTKLEEGKLVEDTQAPFAPGTYVCEVLIDGEEKGRAQFNIDYPPCPSATIINGQVCAGFYPLDPVTKCPKAGLETDDETLCTCEQGGWKCP
jgi:hypothetical protein